MHTCKPLISRGVYSKSQAGYTLIQIAISIMVIGIIFASLMTAFKLQEKRDAAANVAKVVQEASDAVQMYRKVTGRYPCPASLATPRSDVDYGRETDCNDDTGIVEGGTSADGGVFASAGVRGDLIARHGVDTDGDGAPDRYNIDLDGDPKTVEKHTSNGRLRVRVGMIPFRSMNGMTEDKSYDAHGSRLFYAVTEVLAVKADDEKLGAVNITDKDGNPLLDPPSSAHFIIFSAGENRMGGFNREGVVNHPCTGGKADSENCSFVNGGKTDNAFVLSNLNKNDGSDSYDDAVQYFSPNSIDLWRFSKKSGHEKDVTEISANNIGIGTTSPVETVDVSDDTDTSNSQRHKFATTDMSDPVKAGELKADAYSREIPGSVRASEQVNAERICLDGTTNCLETKDFAGELASGGGMECPPGTYATGIGAKSGTSKHLKCNPKVYYGCPDNKVLVGKNADGSPNCVAEPVAPPPPVMCESVIAKVCNKDVIVPTLKATISGNSFTAHPNDITGDAYKIYTCKEKTKGNGDRYGEWTIGSQKGICSCNEEIVSTQSGVSCGTGYSGTYTYEVFRTCPTGKTVNQNSTFANDCQCEGYTTTKTTTCGGNMDGQITEEHKYTCKGNVLNGSPVITVTGNTCACTKPPTRQDVASCPSGLTGSIITNYVLNPSTCSYSKTTTENTCSCVLPTPAPSPKPPVSCKIHKGDPKMTGDVTFSVVADTTACKYNQVANTSACGCDPTPFDEPDNGFTCSDPLKKIKTLPIITKQAVMNAGGKCVTTTIGTKSPGECEYKKFKLVEIRTYKPVSTKPGSPVTGSPCSASLHISGGTVGCYTPQGTGYLLQECRCDLAE